MSFYHSVKDPNESMNGIREADVCALGNKTIIEEDAQISKKVRNKKWII